MGIMGSVCWRFRLVVILGVGVTCGTAVACRDSSPRANASPPTPPAPAATVQPGADSPTYVSADLYRLQSVTDVQLSPDGSTVAYLIQRTDQPGRPSTQLWTADIASGRSTRFGDQEGSHPRWSPDGSQLAYVGQSSGNQAAIFVARRDGKWQRRHRADCRDQPPTAVDGGPLLLVPRWKADRLRLRHPWSRGRA